jgi:hypothetical protein
MHVHSRVPNYEPPSDDPTVKVILADGGERPLTVTDLQRLPVTTVAECVIVTDHGPVGPYTFQGVALRDLAVHLGIGQAGVEIVSGDGFGAQLTAEELASPAPPLLSYGMDGRLLSRQEGLVRLVVPGDQADALRQVKWVATVRFDV